MENDSVKLKMKNSNLKILHFGLSFLIFIFAFLILSSPAQAGTIIRAPAYLGLQSGLVGSWTFDGADIGTSGTIAKDKSGNGNNGTITGAKIVQGKVGQALDFDGVDDKVSVGDLNTVDAVSKMTVSVWVKQEALIPNSAQEQVSVAKYSSNEDGWSMFLRAGNGGDDIRVAIDSNITNLGTLADTHKAGVWEHWLMVFDGTQADNPTRLKFYFNGVQQTLSFTGTIPATTLNTSAGICLGNTENTSGDLCSGIDLWTDQVDDVRIYNRALSDFEVRRLYNIGLGSAANHSNTTSSLQKGLIGCWTFDGAYNKVPDCSGNNNTGTITGTLKQQGKIGQSLWLDGVDDNVNLGDINAVDGASKLTGSMWLKQDSLVTCLSILSKWHTSTDHLDFHTDCLGSNEIKIKVVNSGGTLLCALLADAGTHAAGAWEYWTFVFDGTQTGDANRLKLYKNGVQITGSFPATGCPTSLASSANVLRIGTTSDLAVGSFFNGSVDEVRLYNRALSIGEIVRLYNQTKSKMNASDPDALKTGLIGCWTFDGAYNKVPDCSGNNNTGTITGATKVQGKVGQALSFDGNDVVSIPDTDLPGHMAFSAWINLDRISGVQAITTSCTSGANCNWYFETTGDELLFGFSDGANFRESTTTSVNLTTRTWYHVAVVYDSTAKTANFYVNDVLVADNNSSDTFSQTLDNNVTCIGDTGGCVGASAEAFFGIIDELRIYNRVLSASEVNKLYQMGR